MVCVCERLLVVLCLRTPPLRAFRLGNFALPPSKNCHSGSVVVPVLAVVDDKPSNGPKHTETKHVINMQTSGISICNLVDGKPGGRFPGPRHSVGTGAAFVECFSIEALFADLGRKTPCGRLLLTVDSDRYPKLIGATCCVYHQFIVSILPMQLQRVIVLHLLCHCSGARKRAQLLWIPRSSTRHFT